MFFSIFARRTGRTIRPGRALVVGACVLAAVPIASANATGRFAAPAATAAPGGHAATATPRTVSTTDPLAGGTWGVYTGTSDGVYPAWQSATGANKALLAKVALRPRVRWFTANLPASLAQKRVRQYIDDTQNGDPNVLVQMATFRLWPKGEGKKNLPLTAADQAAYRTWVDNVAAGIGSARVALVLEPDLGVALKGWKPAVRLGLASYAASVFGKLPNTSVYIDAADADWLNVSQATQMLLSAGISHVRGFALGATHYTGVVANIEHGTQIVAALAKAGVPGRHFVIDTADNGRPFTMVQYKAAHPHGNFDNAATCTTKTQLHCDTLGVAPTWKVASTPLHLSAQMRALAQSHVDAYLWFGRPWLYNQASPFSLRRTLAVAASTPW